MRKTAVVLVSTLAVLAAFGLGTQSAAAAANPSIVTVTSTAGVPCTVSATSVRANVGDVLTLHAADRPIVALLDGSSFVTVPGKGSTGVSFPTLGVHTIEVCPQGLIVTVSIVAEPVDAPAVHDDIQQVGVPVSGDCVDVDPAVGHYVGAPIGGWSKSWAWWINDGKGGPVCTRELAERSDGTIVLVG